MDYMQDVLLGFGVMATVYMSEADVAHELHAVLAKVQQVCVLR